MSYARFGEASDVYVFWSVGDWIECCACGLSDDCQQFTSMDDAIAHLDAHRAHGHDVPDHAYTGLEDDRADFAAARALLDHKETP